MKKIFSLSIVILGLITSSCSKIVSEVDKTSVIGTWKLTETLADPGDGSGTWKAVSSTSKDYIKFNTNNTIESVGFSSLKKFKILDSIKVEFTLEDSNKINYRYKINNGTLELNPPCIEACGYRFKKVEE